MGFFICGKCPRAAGPGADQPVRPRTPPGVGTPLRADGRPDQRHPRLNPQPNLLVESEEKMPPETVAFLFAAKGMVPDTSPLRDGAVQILPLRAVGKHLHPLLPDIGEGIRKATREGGFSVEGRKGF